MILVNFLLNRFSVLLWPTLSIISVIFAIVMLNILSRLTSNEKSVHLKDSEILDEVMRLQNTIERTVVRSETQSTLVEKLRSVGLSLVSARLKLTKEEFDAVIDQNPEAAIQLIKDQEMLALLSGKTVNLTDLQRIDAILTKIESV
jgi:hypothetical protein